MASIWGGDNPSVAWNENSWQSNILTVSLTGLQSTTSVGSVDAFNEAGWGNDFWGEPEGWNGVLGVQLTGLSLTSNVNIRSLQRSWLGKRKLGRRSLGTS